MKKLVLLIAVLNIFAISNLQTQWLEKAGYWELSEKIPDLRDLKILPDENLIITVSKDNTIRHIEYDSGIILKSGKPTELTADNDYAKISSDGKTTVVARYKIVSGRKPLKDLEIVILNNSNLTQIGQFTLNNDSLLKEEKPSYFNLNSFELIVKYTDYDYEHKNLIIAIETGIDYRYQDSYQNRTYGSIFKINFINSPIIITKNISYAPKSVIKLQNLKNYNFAYIGYENGASGYYAKGGTYFKKNSLQLLDNNIIRLVLFASSFSGDGYNEDKGYLWPMEQVLESNNDSILYVRGVGKLYNFNLNTKRFTDSVESNFLRSKIWFLKNTNYISHLSNNVYSIYGSLNLKKFIDFTLPSDFLYPQPYIDETNNRTLFTLKDNRIIYKSFDILNDIPKVGFYWNKDTIYKNDSINFRAVSNMEGCTYEWNFSEGDLISTNETDIIHTFKSAGVYSVSLDIIEPNGNRHTFIKNSIITVLEKVKADFETTISNNELPLKVQFTDKSQGTIATWLWNFGDGNTSTESNPIHEYKFPGDFSPSLVVSDGIDKDSIKKYEFVLYMINTPSLNNSDTTIKINSKLAQFRNAFKTLDGLNLNWTKEYFVPYGYLDYGEYYAEIGSIIYDYNFSEINKYAKTHFLFEYNQRLNAPQLINFEKLVYSINIGYSIGTHTYNFSNNEYKEFSKSIFSSSVFILGNRNNSIFWVCNMPQNPLIIKTDYDFNILSELSIPPNAIQYLADTLDNGLNLIFREMNNAYSFFSISPQNKINYENTFTLDTNITLTNIKSVHENLILLHGYYKDDRNKTTYAYFAKYHPLDNTLKDTILYSRTDIRKLERVNNSTYAAIGQSRGRQGYLLLDTNLHQIIDVRVDSLTGEIKDMILHDNKVYLFTEKIVSLPTMALGAKESYQTTASVLGLPEDIIASVEDSPIFFTEKLTHSAYPNPTSEVLNLKVLTNESANYTIKLYDIFGNSLLNIHDGFIPAHIEKIFSIPTTSLPVGSYYYVITGGGNAERGKVMVVR
ncbi:MAG: PKD domain-containing protein [Candidatus Kapabacteria bacterium]|nr:PKD domain-containing protein [Ignavibacteriota bacterium]MCW5885711.1 PKD domain-containing protein [Candidatus Kapabacteria bacterium]